jgi:hypothetical protein
MVPAQVIHGIIEAAVRADSRPRFQR